MTDTSLLWRSSSFHPLENLNLEIHSSLERSSSLKFLGSCENLMILQNKTPVYVTYRERRGGGDPMTNAFFLEKIFSSFTEACTR